MSGFVQISSASRPTPDIADNPGVRGKLTQSSPSGFTTQERILSDHFMLFTEQIGTSRFGYYCGADGNVPENPEHDRWSATKTRSSVGGEIDGQVKTTGWVCLNGGKSGQMALRTKADPQNQAIGWLRKGCSSLCRGTMVRFPRIWMSSGEYRSKLAAFKPCSFHVFSISCRSKDESLFMRPTVSIGATSKSGRTCFHCERMRSTWSIGYPLSAHTLISR